MKSFINGFDSWQESHFEIISEILSNLDQEKSNVSQLYQNGGRGALYTLAENLTNQFEEENQGRAWDGEFFEEIEAFCRKNLENLDNTCF